VYHALLTVATIAGLVAFLAAFSDAYWAMFFGIAVASVFGYEAHAAKQPRAARRGPWVHLVFLAAALLTTWWWSLATW